MDSWWQHCTHTAWQVAMCPTSVQYKMTSHLDTPSVEQCCTIKFLVKVKPAEILHRLMHSIGKRPCHMQVWYKEFSESCKAVSNLPHAHVEPTAV
jgi:hypothetical protein